MRVAIMHGLLLALCVSAVAGESGPQALSRYDRLWDYAVLYKHDDGEVMQRLSLAGRLQADAAYFEAESDDSGSEEFEDALWRRFRIGAKAAFAHDIVAHAEVDIDLNKMGTDGAYKGLTDAYLGWRPADAYLLKLGKQSAPFTLDGATSSTKLMTLERSIVAENLWFTTEYFTGASVVGAHAQWTTRLSLYSASGDEEFGSFDSGYFALASLGREFAGNTGWEALSLRGDYVYNNPDYSGEVGTRNLEQVLSLVAKLERGRSGLWADLSFGDGIQSQSDLWGLQLMPFYDFSARWQGVFRYAVVSSLDGAGVRMGRYARKIEPSLAEEAHDFFLGLNCYLYGHKLKWQSGLEYNVATDLATTGDNHYGWGLTTGLRISW